MYRTVLITAVALSALHFAGTAQAAGIPDPAQGYRD